MSSGVLFERDSELAALDDALAAAQAGGGRIVLVDGPFGTGKSALLQRLVDTARKSAFAVATARGSDLERSLPLGITRQLFERTLATANADERAALLAGAAEGAAAVLLPGRPERDDSGFAALSALFWLTHNWAQSQPLVLAVDDAHAADPASLRFLQYLAPRLADLPVVLALTVTTVSGQATPPAIVELASAPGTRRLHLRPLSPSGVAATVRDRFPGATDRFVDACHTATGGYPFPLDELLSTLVSSGERPDDATAGRVAELVPPSLAARFLSRLSQLSPDAQALARAVAILGEDATPPMAAALAGVRVEALDTALTELAATGAIEVGPLLAYHHALGERAAADAIPIAVRGELHRRAAHLLADAGRTPEHVAVHLLDAPPAGDPWVVSVLRAAAGRATAVGALDVAAEHLRRALAEPCPPDERWMVLQALGWVETAAGDPSGIDHLRAAVEAAPNPEARARSLRTLGTQLLTEGEADAAVRALTEALDEAERAGDPDLVVQLEIGFVTAARNDLRTRPFSTEMLARLTERELDPHSPSGRAVLAEEAYAAALAARPVDEVIALATGALGVTTLLPEDVPSISAYGALLALIWCDRLDAAEDVARALMKKASRQGRLRDLAAATQILANVALRRGSVIELAEQLATIEGIPALVAPGNRGLHSWVLLHQGDADGALEVLDEVAEHWPSTPSFNFHLFCQAAAHLEAGDAANAYRLAIACGERETLMGTVNPAVIEWRTVAALALADLGDRDAALDLSRTEVELVDRFGSNRGMGRCRRTLGRLQTGDEAVATLESALALIEAGPDRLDLAAVLVDLAEALPPSRRDEAQGHLRRALALARELGAGAVAARAAAALGEAGDDTDRPTPLAATHAAALARRGLTAREIAEVTFTTVAEAERRLGHTRAGTGVVVQVLDGFAITRDGLPVPALPATPAKVAKLLATVGAPLHTEEVAVQLWPDADTAAARSRVRNALYRLRQLAGDVVVRDGELLRLGPDVVVDAARFEALARAALDGDQSDCAAALARHVAALDAYAGDLLPGDPYAAWAAAPRERLHRRHLAVLDAASRLATASGDVERAVAFVDEAIQRDPWDEERYLRAAELLLRTGRRSAARARLADAVRMAEELGVPPSPAVTELRETLRG